MNEEEMKQPEQLEETFVEEVSVEDLLAEDLLADETPAEELPTEKDPPPKKSFRRKRSEAQEREDRWIIVWASLACVLCLGIILVLAYWLEFYLK